MQNTKAAVAILCCVLGSCTSAEAIVAVELITDYIPEREFDSVVVTIIDTSDDSVVSSTDVSVGGGEVFLPSRRIARLTGKDGAFLMLRVELLLGAEQVLKPYEIIFTGRSGFRGQVVEIFRKCADVECPPLDNPNATQCYRGSCVSLACLADKVEGECSVPECVDDSGCASSVACGAMQCVSGSCFESADDSLCEAGEICVPSEGGCVSESTDRWSTGERLQPNDMSPGDEFGAALALAVDGRIDGTDILVVGAPGYDEERGRLYIFSRAPGGEWAQELAVDCEGCDAGDGFGSSVAIAGDGVTILVGAPGDDSGSRVVDEGQDDNETADAGSAYRFQWTGGLLSGLTYLKPENADTAHEFGTTVAMGERGGWYFVGAHRESSSGTGISSGSSDAIMDDAWFSGAAYGFLSNGDISERRFVKALNADPNDWFGFALAMSLDARVIAVGAPAEASASAEAGQEDNSRPNTGAAYVFRRTQTEMQYLKIQGNTASGGLFGSALALDEQGKLLLVGAPVTEGSGRAYVFSRANTDSAFGEPRLLSAGDSSSGVTTFGSNVALPATGLFVFVSSADRGGRVHIFTQRSSGTADGGIASPEWAYLQRLRNRSSVAAREQFGEAIAVDRTGDLVAVGALEGDSDGAMGGDMIPGAVYLFERSTSSGE